MRWGWVVCAVGAGLAVSATGCSSSHGRGAGDQDGGGDGDGAQPPDVDAAVFAGYAFSELDRVNCDYHRRCGGDTRPAPACELANYFPCGDVPEPTDADGLGECLALLPSWPCDGAWPPVCMNLVGRARARLRGLGPLVGEGGSCSAYRECAWPLRCSAEHSSECGVCVAEGQLGQPCGDYCVSGYCEAGTCQPYKQPGEACDVGGEEQCLRAPCVDGRCFDSPNDGLSVGRDCEFGFECRSGHCFEGRCETPRAVGEACEVGDHCSSHRCSAGTCQVELGDPCHDDSVCQQGSCLGGFCAPPIECEAPQGCAEGSCPDGMVCGFDGECHSPGAAHGEPCDRDRDCRSGDCKYDGPTGEWFCEGRAAPSLCHIDGDCVSGVCNHDLCAPLDEDDNPYCL